MPPLSVPERVEGSLSRHPEVWLTHVLAPTAHGAAAGRREAALALQMQLQSHAGPCRGVRRGGHRVVRPHGPVKASREADARD